MMRLCSICPLSKRTKEGIPKSNLMLTVYLFKVELQICERLKYQKVKLGSLKLKIRLTRHLTDFFGIHVSTSCPSSTQLPIYAKSGGHPMLMRHESAITNVNIVEIVPMSVVLDTLNDTL